MGSLNEQIAKSHRGWLSCYHPELEHTPRRNAVNDIYTCKKCHRHFTIWQAVEMIRNSNDKVRDSE